MTLRMTLVLRRAIACRLRLCHAGSPLPKVGLWLLKDFPTFGVDQAESDRLWRPLGFAGRADRLSRHAQQLRLREACSIVQSNEHEIVEFDLSFPTLDAVMMRARPATVFQKTTHYRRGKSRPR